VRHLITLTGLLLCMAPASALAEPQLQLEIKEDDIDVSARTVHFRVNAPVQRADIEVFSPDGELLYAGHEDYPDTGSNARLAIGWPDLGARGQNFRIELKFTTPSGSWLTFQIIRFYVEIPHEEVVFDSGKWSIKPDEERKLAKPLALLKESAAKYSALMHVGLYVAGHTDTVGQAADNQKLSERRAEALAQWFVEHGLRTLPIYARGLGESSLAVATADAVAEPKNRRAQYIISSFTPAIAGAGSWRRVR